MRKITLIFALVITAITAMGQAPYNLNYGRINMGLNSSSIVENRGSFVMHNLNIGLATDSVAGWKNGRLIKFPRSQFNTDLSNYVTINTDQNITGAKSFAQSANFNNGLNSFGVINRNALTFENNTSGGTAQSMLYKYAGGYDVFGYDATTRFLTWNRQLNLGALNITTVPTTASNTTQVLVRNPTTGVVESVNSSTFLTPTPTLQDVTSVGYKTTTPLQSASFLLAYDDGNAYQGIRPSSDKFGIEYYNNISSGLSNKIHSFKGWPNFIETELLTILNNGNVGIGTTTPGAKLEVNGSARVATNDGDNTSVFRNIDFTSKVGASNGIAPLDGSSKIPAIYLPAGAQVYKGTWNAATNTPTLADGSGTAGWTYRVETGGTRNLGSGNITFVAGDDVIYNGTIWQRNPSSVLVNSVNDKQGTVVLTTTDIPEGSNLYYTESRVNANVNVSANTASRHNAVTIGTANGLSLSTQQLSLGLAGSGTTGALSSTDWNTFNSKETGFAKNTAFNKNFGTSSGTVTEGNDSRVNNGQTAFNWGNHAIQGYVTASSTNTFTNKSGNITQWTNNANYINEARVATGQTIGAKATGTTLQDATTAGNNSSLPLNVINNIDNTRVAHTDIGLQSTDVANTVVKNLYQQYIGGNVGIGTTTPGAKLEVNGAIRASSNDGTPTGVVRNTDLSGYALTSAIPTQTSQLTNNSGFTTTTYVDSKVQNSLAPSTTVAPSATAVNTALATKQNNLTLTTTGTGGTATLVGSTLNIPVIPTNNNQLTNGRGYITSSDLPILTSGTYTPTITDAINASSITSVAGTYSRIGNIVTVYGTVSFTSASSGSGSINISLPITTYFNNQQELSGHGSGSGVSETIVSANVPSGVAYLQFTAPASGAKTVKYSFQYSIQNL